MSSKNPTPESSPPPGKGPRELREEVLDAGLCTVCGMCLGLCPYLEEMGENVTFISDCRGDQGRCYAVCPRTDTDLDTLRRLAIPAGQPTSFSVLTSPSVWPGQRTRGSAPRPSTVEP